jgi:hypothetical protein
MNMTVRLEEPSAAMYLGRLAESLKGVPNGLRLAMTSAVHMTATQVRKRARELLKERYALPPARLNKAVDYRVKANRKVAYANIYGAEERIPLKEYKWKEATVTRNGRKYPAIKAKTLKAKSMGLIPGAFFARFKTGGNNIIGRRRGHWTVDKAGKRKEPTRSMWGPSFIRFLTQDARFAELLRDAKRNLEQNLVKAAENLLARLAAGPRGGGKAP